MRRFIFFPVSFLLLPGCGIKPSACLSSDPKTGINSKISVNSCSIDVDAYQWKVEGGGETVLAGGNYCDRFIDLEFNTKGEKIVRLIAWKFKKKSNATCEGGLNAGKTDETSYTITVE